MRKGVFFFLLFGGALCAAALELAGPLAFKDDKGNLVRFERPIERVVSLEPSITETLYIIGRFDKLVGYASSESSVNWPEAVKDKPSVGGIRNVSLESVVKLEPDLVLGSAMSEKGLAGIAKLGIKTAYISPGSIDDIAKTMLVVGTILGNEAEAKQQAEEVKSRTAEVRRKTPQKAKTGFFLYSVNPIMIFGSGSLPNEILTLAGLENPFRQLSFDQPVVSQEEVLAADPDYLFLAMGAAASAKDLRTHPFWSRLRAVKNGNVYVPRVEHYLRPSPRVVEGVEVLHALVYGSP